MNAALPVPAAFPAARVIARRAARFSALAGAAFSCLCAAAWLAPLPEKLGSPQSTVVRYADGSPMHVMLSGDDKWRMAASLDRVDPLYIEALVRCEDKRFYAHSGVDFVAIIRSAAVNAATGRTETGASTIAMQLARMLEPKPRNLASKIAEAFRAFQLNLRLGKRGTMEAYLRFLPFGGNTEGIESACYAFFGHGSDVLSPAEICFLLAVPRNPAAYRPSPENYDSSARAAALIASRLEAFGIFGKNEMDRFALEKTPSSTRPFPREAPHAALWLSGGESPGADVHSTISAAVQRPLERILASRRQLAVEAGAWNCAAVVVDDASGDVLALVGNFDFWDEVNSGQVIGFDAPRSTGSTLKPFLYAFGIDRGLILPSHLVADVPVKYGTYEPENFDGSFSGLVTMRDALERSLNVPFVELTRRLGVPSLIQFLKDCGVSSISSDPDRYGLSIAAGGMEVTLVELVNAYAMLSRGGEYLPYRTRLDARPVEAQRMISPSAAWLTREALRDRDRPDFPKHREVVEGSQNVYWKTGTSQGRRDAWCIGGNGRVTAGIWIGNFNGTGSMGLVGAEVAAPVLFDALEAIGGPSPEIPAPGDLVEIELCSYSGRLPGRACPETTRALVPERRISVERCEFHVIVSVDRATGERVDPMTESVVDCVRRPFLVLPPEIRRWMAAAAPGFGALPPMRAGSAAPIVQENPSILSPRDGATFYLAGFLSPDRQEIPMEASASPLEPELNWFVDGVFVRGAAASERLWLTPSVGKHTIRVVNAAGYWDQVEIEIVSQAF